MTDFEARRQRAQQRARHRLIAAGLATALEPSGPTGQPLDTDDEPRLRVRCDQCFTGRGLPDGCPACEQTGWVLVDGETSPEHQRQLVAALTAIERSARPTTRWTTADGTRGIGFPGGVTWLRDRTSTVRTTKTTAFKTGNGEVLVIVAPPSAPTGDQFEVAWCAAIEVIEHTGSVLHFPEAEVDDTAATELEALLDDAPVFDSAEHTAAHDLLRELRHLAGRADCLAPGATTERLIEILALDPELALHDLAEGIRRDAARSPNPCSACGAVDGVVPCHGNCFICAGSEATAVAAGDNDGVEGLDPRCDCTAYTRGHDDQPSREGV